MKKNKEDERDIWKAVKCAGQEKCDEEAGEWALRHQTDLQT